MQNYSKIHAITLRKQAAHFLPIKWHEHETSTDRVVILHTFYEGFI